MSLLVSITSKPLPNVFKVFSFISFAIIRRPYCEKISMSDPAGKMIEPIKISRCVLVIREIVPKVNVTQCNKKKPNSKFLTPSKRTCKSCEFRWRIWLLRKLAYTNKLTPYQKFASRVGYMGAGFVIAGQWTINPILFIIGFICIIVQTSSRKQWNLVALNMNGLIAWITHLIR